MLFYGIIRVSLIRPNKTTSEVMSLITLFWNNILWSQMINTQSLIRESVQARIFSQSNMDFELEWVFDRWKRNWLITECLINLNDILRYMLRNNIQFFLVFLHCTTLTPWNIIIVRIGLHFVLQFSPAASCMPCRYKYKLNWISIYSVLKKPFNEIEVLCS